MVAGKQGRLKNTKLQAYKITKYKIPRFDKVAGKVGTSVDGGRAAPSHIPHSKARKPLLALHCNTIQRCAAHRRLT